MAKKCNCKKGKVWIQTDLENFVHYSFQKTMEEALDKGYPYYVQVGGTPPTGCGAWPKPPCKTAKK